MEIVDNKPIKKVPETVRTDVAVLVQTNKQVPLVIDVILELGYVLGLIVPMEIVNQMGLDQWVPVSRRSNAQMGQWVSMNTQQTVRNF